MYKPGCPESFEDLCDVRGDGGRPGVEASDLYYLSILTVPFRPCPSPEGRDSG